MLTDYAKTFKPFNYPDLMEIAKKHELIHWHEDEIDLGDDIDQWNKGDLSEQETN